jgi:hypothetical protein
MVSDVQNSMNTVEFSRFSAFARNETFCPTRMDWHSNPHIATIRMHSLVDRFAPSAGSLALL